MGEVLDLYCPVTFRYLVISNLNGSGFVMLMNPERNKKKFDDRESLFLKNAMYEYVGLTGKQLT